MHLTGLFPEYEAKAKCVFATDALVQTVQGLGGMVLRSAYPNLTCRWTLAVGQLWPELA